MNRTGPFLAILALFSLSRPGLAGDLIRGHYTQAKQLSLLETCAPREALWVEARGTAYERLLEAYDEFATTAYQSLYVELRVARISGREPPANFDAVVALEQILEVRIAGVDDCRK